MQSSSHGNSTSLIDDLFGSSRSRSARTAARSRSAAPTPGSVEVYSD